MMPVNTNSRSHYKPFGDSIEAPKDGVGYTGHKFDTDLGWSYMQQRYKDPVVGRFMSNDPVGFDNVHNFNRYVYANNNPYKYVDPDGNNAVAAAQVGFGIGTLISHGITAATGASLGVHIYNAVHNESSSDSSSPPKVPDELVGDQGDSRAGPNKTVIGTLQGH
ncbi:MAG: RHS repeat-associated protein [Phenylobacterium sp.]|jgi:RHS repeat-associated protein